MDIETTAESTILTAESVGKKHDDGTLPITRKIESIKATLDLPGGIEVRYDSAEPDAKIDNPQLAFLGDVYKLLLGSSHTFVLDETGKVKFVEGTEKDLGKLEGLDPKVSALLKKQLQSETLQRRFEQIHASLPETGVKPGDTWERIEDAELGGGQTLTFKKRYEYLGPVEEGGKTLDKIDVKALEVTYNMDADAESPLEHIKSDLKIDSSEGTLLFDLRLLGHTVEVLRELGDAHHGGHDIQGRRHGTPLQARPDVGFLDHHGGGREMMSERT